MCMKKIEITPIISALALLLSFNYPVFWSVGLFALVPFLVWIYKAENWKKVFIWGLVFGFIFMGGVISWFWSAYPLDWAGIDSAFAAISPIFFIWSLSATVFALFIALWAVAFWRLKRNSAADLFIAAFLWIIFEYARSWAFSIFWAGSGALIGAHWSLGFLGYILANNAALLQLAGMGGVYLLSFVVVLLNILVYGVWHLWHKGFFSLLKNKIIAVFALLLIVIVISGVNYFLLNSAGSEERITAALLTTNVPAVFGSSLEERGVKIEQLYEFLDRESSGLKNVDLLVFPESSGFINAVSGLTGSLFLKMLLGEDEKLVIDSSPVKVVDKEDIYSRMYYLNTKKSGETFNDYYDKLFLMPYGEYIPYFAEIFARVVGYSEWVQDFIRIRGFSGGDAVSLGEFRGIKIGALFCSETISPALYRELASKGAEVLVSVSSYAVFHGSPLHFQQLLAMAKVRAVENNRYFLQASNFAPSFVIDNHGRLLQSSVRGQDSVLYGNIEVISQKSFYNALLDLF
ncbi:MAG: apolipoprotein N-acyltransferase [Patescibacteria group bacterium]